MDPSVIHIISRKVPLVQPGQGMQLKAVITTLAEAIPHEEIGTNLAKELYSFVLQDSKVPDAVIKGVGQFIDFRKYLGSAAAKGAEEATKQAKEKLRNTLRE